MRGLLVWAMLLVPLPALAGPVEDVVTVERAWSEAFAHNDWAAVTALYTDDATLYGSKPDLSVNREGVRAYFNGLPKGFKSAAFGEPLVRALGPDVLTASGPLTFEREADGKTSMINWRITLVLVRQDGAWRIAAQHASPR